MKRLRPYKEATVVPAQSPSSSVMFNEAMVDRKQAMLAKSALEHVGGLSVMAGRLSEVTPQSKEIYMEIVNAYAQKAIQRIERW
ncbi:MAG: hypothetical protein NC305_11030 [Lachnospiraceae bacterium]|nr:hypothetical protein [Muribaculaceae bacterium]MCM1411066.1 hypothetical protein [Lachnospiraceae bacterium]